MLSLAPGRGRAPPQEQKAHSLSRGAVGPPASAVSLGISLSVCVGGGRRLRREAVLLEDFEYDWPRSSLSRVAEDVLTNPGEERRVAEVSTVRRIVCIGCEPHDVSSQFLDGEGCLVSDASFHEDDQREDSY